MLWRLVHRDIHITHITQALEKMYGKLQYIKFIGHYQCKYNIWWLTREIIWHCLFLIYWFSFLFNGQNAQKIQFVRTINKLKLSGFAAITYYNNNTNNLLQFVKHICYPELLWSKNCRMRNLCQILTLVTSYYCVLWVNAYKC